MRTKGPSYTAKQKAAAAWLIDLTGMDPAVADIVRLHFRVAERRGELTLFSAFKIINQVEGSKEYELWEEDKERWKAESQQQRWDGPKSGGCPHEGHDNLLTLPDSL